MGRLINRDLSNPVIRIISMKLRKWKVILPVSIVTVGVVLVQGYELRRKYVTITGEKLLPPSGPLQGVERWTDVANILKNDVIAAVRQQSEEVAASVDIKVSEYISAAKEKLDEARERKGRRSRKHFISKRRPLKSIHRAVIQGIVRSGKEQKEQPNNHTQYYRPIRLIVIGDSLVAGVGCEDERKSVNENSPLLPRMVASLLSTTLGTEVEWHVAGIVGGTVKDLRNYAVPQLRRKLIAHSNISTSDNDDQDAAGCKSATFDRYRIKREFEYNSFSKITDQTDSKQIKSSIETKAKNNTFQLITVVICGLNDWKSMFERFPRGLGPSRFKQELSGLIGDIKELNNDLSDCSGHSSIFLPRLPLVCLESDPNYTLGVKPLSYAVNYLCYVWDQKKQEVAIEARDGGDDKSCDVFMVDVPNTDSTYATPGEGNVSSDGVHPSVQGYTWWAQHIAERIVIEVVSSSRTSVHEKFRVKVAAKKNNPFSDRDGMAT